MYLKLNKIFTLITILLAISFYIGLEFNKDILIAQTYPKQEVNEQLKKETDKTLSENNTTTENNEEKKDNIQKSEEEKENRLENSITTIWSLFLAGGPFMWPLLLASIIGFAITMERLYYFSFHKFTSKTFEQNILDKLNEGIDSAINFINEHKRYLISKILSEGLEVSNYEPDNFIKGVEREALSYFSQAERGLPVLAAISTIAPLIGFLGTVSGMINAFDAIANADSVNAKIVAAGIKEALITTATGLIVAIPAMAFFQYFQNKVNAFAAEIETVANHIYKELLRIKGKSSEEIKNTIKQTITTN
ncbi:MAG: hypothetical protein KatS3mg129_1419 [Leptospiraceae bacterium]|nr:MAG: hypothetical protein KatS3mg129_1419 [Leptospiraceae bacterium]